MEDDPFRVSRRRNQALPVLFFFLVHLQTARTVQAVTEIALLRDAKGET